MPMTAPVLTPPLREGDPCTPDEFLRRWETMPNVKFAELLDGVVHMPSPLSDIHADYHPRLTGWAWSYALFTPNCKVRSDVTSLMSPDSVMQPDISLRLSPEAGGKVRVIGNYPSGAPELIVEISHTTFARDSGPKLRLYQRIGVQEYIIVRPDKRQIIWHELVDGKYQEIALDQDGLFRSHVFPGLWLNPEALWNNDAPALFAVIQRGVATEEHQAFVDR